MRRSATIRKRPKKEILAYSECRELEPEDEERLEGEIPWEVVENDAEGEGLGEVEEPKDDPVSQPLDVILWSGRLERLERQKGGETPTKEVRNGSGERVEGMENEEERNRADDDVRLGHLSALLESLQGGIVVELSLRRVSVVLGKSGRGRDFRDLEFYLLIKLGNVVVGLSLGLDVDGMVLDTFGCGHGQLFENAEISSGSTKKEPNSKRRDAPYMKGEVEVGRGSGGEGDGLVKKRFVRLSAFIRGEGGRWRGEQRFDDDALHARGNHMTPAYLLQPRHTKSVGIHSRHVIV